MRSRAEAAAPSARPWTTFPLLESKLCPTPPRLGTITRPALVNRLRAARSATVAVVTAPAGYGKTTLLADWERRDERPFAWISLDEADNDPTVFLTYLAVALDRVQAIDPDVFVALSRLGTSPQNVVARLGRSLSPLPVVVVLDDVHVLRSRECTAALATLVDELPAGSQLVLASRTAPELQLGRLRAEGRIVEVGSGDLSLNEREAQALLQAAGLRLAEEDVAELTQADRRLACGALPRGTLAARIGRWAAGRQLDSGATTATSATTSGRYCCRACPTPRSSS